MHEVPLDHQVIDQFIEEMGIHMPRASIREMNALVNRVEEHFGIRFIRMEFGIPGFHASEIAVEAESQALREGQVANVYAPFEGIPALKKAGARFAKAFLDLDLPPSSVIPSNGAMQSCFIAIGLAGLHNAEKDTILFLDPGFPVNKLQTKVWGLNSINLDLKDYRGKGLVGRVDELCRTHGVGGCMWSSPNNPSWVNLTDAELKGLAEVLDRHGVFAIEDMAYFGMDFREDYSAPFQPPFQPTIARYMHRVFVIISSSKLFNYAGQRCAITLIPREFAKERYPDLKRRMSKATIRNAFLQDGIYPTTASIAQSPQHGLAALLNAAVEGRYNPWLAVREYEKRAAFMKKAFTDNGFYIVYDRDGDKPLADGFYFTIAYPGKSGAELASEIIYYGISAITLDIAGSRYKNGLRACVSLTTEDQYKDLVHRLEQFHQDHPLAM